MWFVGKASDTGGGNSEKGSVHGGAGQGAWRLNQNRTLQQFEKVTI